MGKTLFAGEYSSKNVGDGIIKLAIKKLCRDNGVEAEFKDFFGNPIGETSFTLSHAKPKKNTLKMRLLQSSTVNYLVSILFYFTRYKKIAASYQTQRYAQVVIGGGNLLMDNFLNFPLLILRVVQECERNGVPVKLFSVGAGKKYSWLARKIVARILRSPVVASVMCRDDHSRDLVRSTVDDGHADKVHSSFDSALYLDRENTAAQSSSTVGLGVIAPSILKTIIPEHPMSDKEYALRWWAGVVESLAAQVGSDKVELLSNGSDLDNAFAQELWESLKPKYPGLSVCTTIRSPVDLMNKIGSYRALAAYRMHAAVTAMALQVPVVGFEWDPKVLHMFTYCGKRDSCISLAQFTQRSAQTISSMLLKETPAHIDPIRASLKKDFLFTVNAVMPS